MNRARRIVLACLVGLLAVALSAGPADATVGVAPASWTPSVTSKDATVRKIVQCGSHMYAVGAFSRVSWNGGTYNKNNVFRFNATTGAVSGWNPAVNGGVESIALSADCSVAYLGGTFTTAGSTAVQNLVAVSTSTGAVMTRFAHAASGGAVHTLALVNGGTQLLVGGAFTKINGVARPYYASVSPTTGAMTNYLTAAVAGKLPPYAGGTMIYNQQLSPQGDQLLAEGDFTSVGGKPRLQVVQLDLGRTAATVDPWYNQTLNTTYCSPYVQFYVRAAAYSPDGNTIYLATTGEDGSSPFCDALTAFTNTAPATVKWSNKTGRDSLYAVAASATDVYIGGHERWANNPNGEDSCGSGCVSRPGIGDISASTGLATSWNPTRDRGHGADDMLITSAGLWVASDTFFDSVHCGGVYHPGICFFPGRA